MNVKQFEQYQAMLDEFIKNNYCMLEELFLSNLVYCNDVPYGNRNVYYDEFDYTPYIDMEYVDKGYVFERYKLRVDKVI